MENVSRHTPTNKCNKLKTYHFIHGGPATDDSTLKSRETHEERVTEEVPTAFKAEFVESRPDGSQSTKPYPSTPSARLPLTEVNCNTSRNYQSAILSTTPEEYIGWRTILSPKGSGLLEFIGTKKRKRNRSSSPLRSSQDEASQLGHKPVAHSENAPKTLRTPRVDPAADLWTKYTADKANVNAEPKPRPLKSISLVEHSSPDPNREDSTRKVGGLRRWASCGIEWPTSRAKRRKTKASSRGEKADISYDNVNLLEMDKNENAISSKLGFLIERMQETLAATSDLVNAPVPSSSSPLPKYSEAQAVDSKSPSRLSRHGAQLPKSCSDLPTESLIIKRRSPRKDRERSEGQHVGTKNHYRDRPIAHNTEKTQKVPKSESDEFSEESIFANELESFASLYDNRSDGIPEEPLKIPSGAEKDLKKTGSTEKMRKVNSATFLSSDDDYGGDDIDAEQCAVVEALATQRLPEDRGSQFTVCRAQIII